MKKYIIFFPVLFSCFLFLNCDMGSERILEKYIPPDALVVVQVLHPDTFFENMDSFIKPLGGIPLMGDVPVKDFLKSITGTGSPVKFEWFDFTMPWGGALLPSENRINDFSIMLCIPVLRTADYKAIEKQALLSGFSKMKISGRYILLSNRERPVSKGKKEKKINLSRLSNFDRGALACQLNIHNILAATGLNSKLITNLLGTVLATTDTASLEKNMKMTMGFFVKLFETVEQIEEISAGVLLNGKGMNMKTFIQFSGQGWVNDCLSTLAMSSGIKEYLEYIPREYLFSMALNLNSDFLSDITERYYNFILPYMEIKADDAKKLMDTIKKGINASGKRTALAMDIHLNSKKSASERVIPDLKEMNLSASLLSCIELRDAAGYRNAMEEISTSDIFLHILNSFMEKMGIEFSIKYNKNMEKEGLTYDELGYTINMSEIPPDTKDKSGYADMIKMSTFHLLMEFFNNFKLYLGFKPNHCFLVSGDSRNQGQKKDSLNPGQKGDSGIEQLRQCMEKDKYGGDTLLNTDVYTHFEPDIPENAHLIGHFSIPGIISMIPDMPEIDLIPGFIFYGKVDTNLFESGCYWDIGEIKMLYDQFFSVLPYFLDKIPHF